MMKKSRFNQALKPRHILAVAIGGTISSTYFLGNGYLLNQLGPLAFLAFIFGGLITYLTMNCMAELAGNENPSHHSFVGYAKEFISSSFACGVGWSYWTNWVIYIPTECISGGILMHVFFPQVPVYAWATLFGFLITYVNVCHVRIFANASFWLTFTHIALFALFCFMAVMIFFGWIGTGEHEVIGLRYIVGKEGLLPNGIAVFFVNMVIMLLNFQGTEIIGLSASEAHHPSENIPHAMREISLTITFLYVMPILLLALIFPWQKANISGSVFAEALADHGFLTIAKIFTFLIVAGVLSCANSGLYAANRAMHALAAHGMSPKYLEKLNSQGIPLRTTLFTFGVIWLILFIAYFFPSHKVYANFLALSGFTGSIAWISICWSQYRYRKALLKKDAKALRFKIAGFPYLTLFAIWIQVICLGFLVYSANLRPSFYLGVPVLIIPMLIYKYRKRFKLLH
jgi:AAT family amino acid transporter